MNIMHVFHEVHLGLSHGGLGEILKQKTGRETLKDGEMAIFMNKKWTGCKILAPGGVLLYCRQMDGSFLSPDEIRRIPTLFGGKLLTFGGANEAKLLKAFEQLFGGRVKRLRAV